MDLEHALAQARRYAEELRAVHGREQAQLRAAEDALAKPESSYRDRQAGRQFDPKLAGEFVPAWASLVAA